MDDLWNSCFCFVDRMRQIYAFDEDAMEAIFENSNPFGGKWSDYRNCHWDTWSPQWLTKTMFTFITGTLATFLQEDSTTTVTFAYGKI